MPVINQKELEIQFHKDMLNIYENARKIGYNASRFKQMVANQGGLNVAKKFIINNIPSEGFTNLWELRRLDLTVEALVIKSEYKTLFSETERKIVINRLEEYGFFIEVAPASESSFIIPDLEPVKRSREYNSYDDAVRSKVVYEYIFNSKTHRWLDENIMELNPTESRGYQAMGILHHIGLKDKHKGLFNRYETQEAISILRQQQNDFQSVIECLELFKIEEKHKSDLVEYIKVDIDSELSEEEGYYKDGATAFYYGKRYERNPANRAKAIAIHGLSCMVCRFNFEEVYGERGKDFIEVHHVKPLSTIQEEVVINPETDLFPVCPNCHRMIHRKKDEVLTIEELRELIKIGSERNEDEN